MKQHHRFYSSLIIVVSILGTGAGTTMASDGAWEAVPAAQWIIETVDATRTVGYEVSVATDTVTGDHYISYYEGIDGDLWLARTGAQSGNCGPGNRWECQAIDTAGVVGKGNSIVVGGIGTIAAVWISYYDATTGSLKVAKLRIDRTTGAVVTTDHYIVDLGDPNGSGVVKGTRTSVTLNSAGNPQIAYQVRHGGATRSVKHAYKIAPGFGNCGYGAGLDGWQCEGVHIEDGIGDYVDIDVGPGGVTNIAFSTTAHAYAQPVIATDVGSGGSCSSGTFTCAYIFNAADTGEYLSFEIAAGGVKHLAYRNATTESLEWARYVGPGNGNCGPGGDSYQCEWIDDIGPSGEPAGIDMKIDASGNPVIAYQDNEAGFEDLKLARPMSATSWSPVPNCGPNPGIMYEWLCETLEEGNLSHSQAYGGLAVALDALGDATVAYRQLYDPLISPEVGRLKVATEAGIIFRDGFETGDLSVWSSSAE